VENIWLENGVDEVVICKMIARLAVIAINSSHGKMVGCIQKGIKAHVPYEQ
jgi:hypothetical protein